MVHRRPRTNRLGVGNRPARIAPPRSGTTLLVVVVAAVGLLPVAMARADEVRVPATVQELFSPPFMTHVEISPSGRHAASIFLDRERWGVKLKHLESGDEVDVLGGELEWLKYSVEDLLWDGPDSLIIEYGAKPESSHSQPRNYYDHLTLDARVKGVEFRRRTLKTPGTIVDASPSRPGEVLFVHADTPDSVHRVSIRRLEFPLESWRKIDSDEPDAPALVAKLNDSVFSWLVDHEGTVRAALSFAVDPPELRLWYRDEADSRWQIVRREDDVDRFDDLIPLGFSADGRRLLVASALERDRYGLYEFDPGTNTIGKLLYEHPTAELVDLVLDPERGEVVAAVYIEDGEQRYAYLSTGSDELRAAISNLFTDSIVAITGMSADRRLVTLFVSRSNDPGGFVAYDLDAKKVTPIGRVAPWLDDDLLAEVEVLNVPTTDGHELEAFLTLPPVPGSKPPLVVMPHGGPIGIADHRGYSPDVQYLARSGFAVLQVNYRGSGGYGRQFREAGHRQWGRGIEDDIDAAVAHVLASGRVDGERMCTAGASYGGYSALMMVIRHPKRYRCAASLSGVTDIALVFNVDEVMGGELLTSQMEKIVGDPDQNYDEMRRYSPVYNADKIEVPIHLAHGESDRTVDLDHLIRMKLALEVAKVPVKAILYAEMGHGFETRDAAVRYWLSLYEFLAENLKR